MVIFLTFRAQLCYDKSVPARYKTTKKAVGASNTDGNSN